MGQKRKRYASQRQREIIYERDQGRCVYCHTRVSLEGMRADHVVPWSKGGRTVVANLVTCCNTCNRNKFDQDKDEFEEVLTNVMDIPRTRGVSNPLIGKAFANYYRDVGLGKTSRRKVFGEAFPYWKIKQKNAKRGRDKKPFPWMKEESR